MIKIGPEPTEQIRRASAWWREHRESAPDAIDEELRKAFQTLLAGRAFGERVPTARRPRLMRLHLRRIHYHLYYELDGDDIEILALWHTNRGSGPSL